VKKRLRNKRRLGKFREDCFALNFRVDPSLNRNEADEVFNQFLKMIEHNDLQYEWWRSGRKRRSLDGYCSSTVSKIGNRSRPTNRA
jgi:uncharacterized protein YggL (DUF469 family)